MNQDAIARFDETYRQMGLHAQRQYPNEALIRFSLRLETESKVLEIGCGSGANIWMLAKEGFDTHGIDASEAAIDLARAHLRDKWNVEATLSVARFDKLPYPDDYFDAIVDVVSLQHATIDENKDALLQVARCLTPNGRFFSYRLGDRSSAFANSGGSWIDEATVDDIRNEDMPLAGNGPTSFWSPSLCRRIYGQAGLQLESIEHETRTYSGNGVQVEYLVVVASLSKDEESS